MIRLFASSVDAGALAPLARVADRGIEALPAWEPTDGGGLRLAMRLDRDSLAGADRVIPSFSSVRGGDYAFRFGLRVQTADRGRTPWIRLLRIGRPPPGAGAAATAPATTDDRLEADVDTFLLRAPAASADLELRVWPVEPEAFWAAPCLLAISAVGPPDPSRRTGAPREVPALRVPALTQMLEDEAIRSRICSPTSVAMVLRALGMPEVAAGTPAEIATDAYCVDVDRYGVWPAAVWAGSRRGALGCVLALRAWEPACALLASGHPLVISEAHGPGGLPGSPLPETDGHLLVLRGIERGRAVVNDPAAPTPEAVERTYPLADLGRAWLGHGGIAYAFVGASPPGEQGA